MTPAQCRAARALVDWSQQRLADASKLGNAAIRDFERGKSAPQNATLAVLRTVLEGAGVIFVAENGEGAGVRLRKGVGTSPVPIVSEEEMQASAATVRAQAASAADDAMSRVAATKQEKAQRRGALTDEPALIAKARGKGGG